MSSAVDYHDYTYWKHELVAFFAAVAFHIVVVVVAGEMTNTPRSAFSAKLKRAHLAIK